VWCGVNRQRAERSRALGPVRPTSDATRGANAAQPTARRRRQRRRPTHPRNTHERAATSDATNTTTTSSRCRCHGTAARLRGGRTHEECSGVTFLDPIGFFFLGTTREQRTRTRTNNARTTSANSPANYATRPSARYGLGLGLGWASNG